MNKSSILSLFLLSVSTFASSCSNSTFQLTYIEDKKAYHSRRFHIFYDPSLKSLAQQIECHVGGTVKKVDLVEIPTGYRELDGICESKDYMAKMADKLHMRDYMVTITKQKKYIHPLACNSISQFNLMKTPHNEWAVQIRGHSTDMVLPMDSKKGDVTHESLSFALNALFFATSYGFGDAGFKSLDDGGFKKKFADFTLLIYCLAVLVAVVALVVLFALFIVKKHRNAKKRESEKSKLLRNSANNNCDDSPVDLIIEETDNKS